MSKVKYPEWVEIDGKRIPARLTQTQLVLDFPHRAHIGYRTGTRPELKYRFEFDRRTGLTSHGARAWRNEIPVFRLEDGQSGPATLVSPAIRKRFDDMVKRRDEGIAYRKVADRRNTIRRYREEVQRLLIEEMKMAAVADESEILVAAGQRYRVASLREEEDWAEEALATQKRQENLDIWRNG